MLFGFNPFAVTRTSLFGFMPLVLPQPIRPCCPVFICCSPRPCGCGCRH